MKKILISLLALVIMMVSVPAGAFAASKNTVKSNMYEIFKQKSIVYVQCNSGLYRVKLKSGKPVSKRKIVKCGKKYAFEHFLVKGKYVYFKKTAGEKVTLYRVKKTGGMAKKLVTMPEFGEVAFKDKKIYYTYDGETDKNGKVIKIYKNVMNLNGTGKKNSKYEAVENDKYHNVKGYKYVFKATKSYLITYLKTPKGKIVLEKQKI